MRTRLIHTGHMKREGEKEGSLTSMAQASQTKGSGTALPRDKIIWHWRTGNHPNCPLSGRTSKSLCLYAGAENLGGRGLRADGKESRRECRRTGECVLVLSRHVRRVTSTIMYSKSGEAMRRAPVGVSSLFLWMSLMPFFVFWRGSRHRTRPTILCAVWSLTETNSSICISQPKQILSNICKDNNYKTTIDIGMFFPEKSLPTFSFWRKTAVLMQPVSCQE